MDEPAALSPDNALKFLAGRIELSGRTRASMLAGGVSNTVVLVEDEDQRIVLKQSLPRLRVRDEWLADRSRILREWRVMEALAALLPAGRLPQLLFCDEPQFLYGMRAAPVESMDWKTHLLTGDCDTAIARQAGATLGLIVRETSGRARFREQFGDRTAFEQLRTNPYYRTVGARHPWLATAVEAWIAASSERSVALVHGDWSPKNLLVGPHGLVCIDFECAHWGDPSYDAAFMLNHLLLKAFHRPDLAYRYLRLARISFAWTVGMLPPDVLGWFEAASMRHAAFLMLARIDGKSPVEYLREAPVRHAVRQLAMRLVAATPQTIGAALDCVEEALTKRFGNVATGPP